MASTTEGAKFIKLLGEKLVGQDGAEIATKDLVANDVVGIYFSAHWCPPCRGFTPVLAESYKKIRAAGKKFDVVFASSDKNQGAFDSYFKEMPWKALPYSDRDRKNKLSGKFKVSGIPTLILLDPKTGKVIDANGRSVISGDKTGEKFPWVKPPLKDVLAPAPVVKKDGTKTTFGELLKTNNYLILYFSAHWCPPCRGFTPKFAEWYKKNVEAKKGTDQSFEAVFVSSDRDESAFNDYWGSMPWHALPYSERELKSTLSDAFDVQGIPSVIVIDKEGNTITDKGRAGVTNDADAEEFPWPKKDYADFNSDPGDVNSYPSVIFMLDKLEDKAKNQDKIELLAKLAAARKAECAKEEEDLDLRFYYATESTGPAAQIRNMMKITDDSTVTAVFVNFGNNGAYKLFKEELTDATLAPMIAKLAEGELCDQHIGR